MHTFTFTVTITGNLMVTAFLALMTTWFMICRSIGYGENPVFSGLRLNVVDSCSLRSEYRLGLLTQDHKGLNLR